MISVSSRPDLVAVGPQRLVEVEPERDVGRERHVPLIGVAGDGPERAPLALAADRDREMGLDRFRFAPRVGQFVEAAGERGVLVVEQRPDDRHTLVETIEAFLQRTERDAVRVRLRFEPSGAQAQHESAVGDVVDRHRHVGGHRRVAVVHPVDHRPEPESGRRLGECGEHRPALEMGAVHRRRERIEVVHRPRRLEHVDLVGGEPHVEELAPRSVLRRRLDGVATAHDCRLRSSRSSVCIAGRHCCDRGVRLAPLGDGGEELAVLELDAVHRDVDLRDVDRLFATVDEIVVAGDVRAVVADVAEERAERPVVVERQRQRAQRARPGAFIPIVMSIAMPSSGWIGPCCAHTSPAVSPVWYWNRSTV